jgi:acyl-CoA synthetase (NDP forming)
VSSGNGIVLDATDYLDYFGGEADIKAIAMYLEGVKDGRRFLTVVREVSAQKPVVIWKGGQTEAGERAITSHTGSLARSRAIWDIVMRQSGAIKVTSLEELIDTLKAILYLAPVYGDRVAIVGGSGGESVAIVDGFVEYGLEVPLLTQKSYEELVTFFNLVGASCHNPIDPGINWGELKFIMEIVEENPNIDNIVVVFVWSTLPILTPEQLESHINLVINMRKKASKPIMVILLYSSSLKDMYQTRDITQKLHDGGIRTFDNVERAAQALRNSTDNYSFKNSIIG